MFGRVGLCMYVCMHVCVYVCMYMWTKKWAVWGLTTRKSPVSVIYCSLIKFKGQKRGLLCQVICSGKEIWNHSINGDVKRVLENCITVSHALCTCNACSYACNANECRTPTYNCSCADLQYRYSLY